MSTNFNIRMDEDLKEQAFPVIESYCLTRAQAVKLFLRQIADTRVIPLSFDYKAGYIPNSLTQRAIEEARAEPAKTLHYKTVTEAVEAIQALADK